VALHGNISAPVRVTDLVEASKDTASLLVCTRKNFFAWGCGFFVSDVISGGRLGHLGPARQHKTKLRIFAKKTSKRTWLCMGISPLLYGLRIWSKRQKTRQVF